MPNLCTCYDGLMATRARPQSYTIVLSYDRAERVYNVSVPALPGCYTWGRTRRQAVKSAREAIRVYIETLKKAGSPVPSDDVELRVLKLA